MITVSGLTKTFGTRVLFREVELRVGARDRIAIVGPNGSGKTTLLDILAGDGEADAGSVRMTRDAVLGYLRQETDALRGRSILEEVVTAGGDLSAARHRLHVLEEEIAAATGEEKDELLRTFAKAQERFGELGGFTIESEARRVLTGLGFRESDLTRRTETLSGGWLMRVALAKLLLAQPDALLLDEPTNHLDLESQLWLERFLYTYEGAIVLVSHDRDFLNGLATKIIEIDNAALVSYTGNYESFVEQRQIRAEQAAAAARNQAKKIEHTQAFIDRFRYKASKARQVQSRIKALDKMERVEVVRRPKRAMKLAFPAPPRAGRVVISLHHVTFGYADMPVYSDLDLEIERGEKVALVGPNGAGKTTLLKLCAGALQPQSGERVLGYNVELGYFAQHQIEALDPTNRVVQELERAIPAGVTLRPRDLLGRFLFSGDDIDKPVSVLSGGERTRLALAKLLVSKCNLLCLDEPTNHLDITSRDVLEDALLEYPGALVLITHDRHLIRSIANRVIEVTAGQIRSFEGDYESYLWRKEREDADAAEQAPKPAARSASSDKERRRAAADARAKTKALRDALRKVEAELESTHASIKELDALLADPDFYQRGEGVPDKIHAYELARSRIGELESEWERLTDALGGDSLN